MKFTVYIIAAFALFSLYSCGGTDAKSTNEGGETNASISKGDYYFTYTIDGKKMEIPQDAITASLSVSGAVPIFKIFAGNYGETGIVLTIPNGVAAPSVTASGSLDDKLDIKQGSVSLQEYPEKGYTTNSFDYIYPDKTPIKPDAITITASEKEGDVARIISGKFSVTTYGDFSGTDPKSTNHLVEGSFRIRHEFSSTNGGPF